MVRKLVGLLVLVTAALFVAPSHSGAQTDYSGCLISLNPPSLFPGQTTQVSGTGLQPNFGTQIILDRGLPTEQILANVTPNAQGAFSIPVTIPANLPLGSHTLALLCGFGAGFSSGGIQVLGEQDILPDLFLSKSVVRRLETFLATVVRAQPGSTVTFAQLSTRVVVGSAVADSQGTAKLEMSFPATATLGDHQVEAVGTDFDGDPFQLRDPIKVIADSVPRTGSEVGPQVAAGIAAVLVGAALVVVSRRRRAAHAAG